MTDADSIKEKEPDPWTAALAATHETCTAILQTLWDHCGERGNNEGAVETLNRIIRERDTRVYYQEADDEQSRTMALREGYIAAVEAYGIEKDLAALMALAVERFP